MVIILGVSARVFLNENNIFIDRIKQISPTMWVGLVQSLEGLDRVKRSTFSRVRELSSKLPSDLTCTISFPGISLKIDTINISELKEINFSYLGKYVHYLIP